jgi:hypothetical protein
MVEAMTVDGDQIRPALGIRPHEFSPKFFEMKVLPASD